MRGISGRQCSSATPDGVRRPTELVARSLLNCWPMARLRAIAKSKTFIILAALLLLLIAARVALEPVVERYANKTLDELEGYSGHIEDVDIALLRGAYVIEGLRISKTGGKVESPEVGVWSALGSLLKNAIIQALNRGLEGSVDIREVSGKDDGKPLLKSDDE